MKRNDKITMTILMLIISVAVIGAVKEVPLPMLFGAAMAPLLVGMIIAIWLPSGNGTKYTAIAGYAVTAGCFVLYDIFYKQESAALMLIIFGLVFYIAYVIVAKKTEKP